MNETKYMTLKEAKDYTHLSASTLRRRVADGTLRRASFTGRVLIPVEDLNKCVRLGTTNSKTKK